MTGAVTNPLAYLGMGSLGVEGLRKALLMGGYDPAILKKISPLSQVREAGALAKGLYADPAKVGTGRKYKALRQLYGQHPVANTSLSDLLSGAKGTPAQRTDFTQRVKGRAGELSRRSLRSAGRLGLGIEGLRAIPNFWETYKLLGKQK